MSDHSPDRTAGQTLSTADAVDLSQRIAELSKAGLPLPAGLRATAEEVSSRRVRRVLNRLADDVEAGRPFDEALQSLGDRFPPHVRGLIVAGVRSGQLGDVLEKFVEHHRQAAALRRRALLALVYPSLLIAMVIGVTLFFAATVATDLAQIVEDLDSNLPPQTELLLMIPETSWFWLFAVLAVVAAVFLITRFVLGRVVFDIVASFTPLVGSLWQWAALSEFCRLLATLVEREVPLPEALRLSAAAVRDVRLAAGCQQLATRVSAGQRLSEAAQDVPSLPPTFTALVAWDETMPALVQSLRSAARLFHQRAMRQLTLIQRVAPAFTFVLVLMAVGFLISAILSPIVNLINTLT